MHQIYDVQDLSRDEFRATIADTIPTSEGQSRPRQLGPEYLPSSYLHQVTYIEQATVRHIELARALRCGWANDTARYKYHPRLTIENDKK